MSYSSALVLCAAVALTGLAAATARAAAPEHIVASYDAFKDGLHVALIHETFERKDKTYRIVAETHAAGLLALVQKESIRSASSGAVTRHGLRPDRFEASRGDPARTVSAEFDWHAERLIMRFNGRTETAALAAGTQDRLSVMYQFMFAPLDKLKQLVFAMTNGQKVERYRYSIGAGGELDTALGRLATLHLVKERAPGENGVEIWVAPQHNFLPVRVLIEETDGSRLEQVITRLEVR